MKAVERVLLALAGALALVGAAAMAGIFALVFAAVVLRYGWGRPLAATEELAGLLMTTAVFALLPLTILKDNHIRVTALSERLRGTASVILYVAGQAILVAFAGIFLRETWAIAAFTERLGLLSEQSRLPLAPFLMFAAAAIGLAAVCGLWRAFRPAEKSAAAGPHP